MFFLDSIALLVLLSVSHTSAQSFNNESSTQTTLSPSSNATVSPSPSRTLNITSSQGTYNASSGRNPGTD